MNREYIYRGKCLNWAELPKEKWWVYGDLIREMDASGKTNTRIYQVKGKGLYRKYDVDPETVCEYTQMKDNNKKMIWENDIVSVEHSKYEEKEIEDLDIIIPNSITYKRNYSVEFVSKGGHCGYRCRNKSIHFPISPNTIRNCKITVIGNLFDNPEFLNGDRQK